MSEDRKELADINALVQRIEGHAARYERSAIMAENRAGRRLDTIRAPADRSLAKLSRERAQDMAWAAAILKALNLYRRPEE